MINFSIVPGPGTFVGEHELHRRRRDGQLHRRDHVEHDGHDGRAAPRRPSRSAASLLTRATDDGKAGDSADAQQDLGQRAISIAPSATNEVGQPHTFTVTLLKDTGTGSRAGGRRARRRHADRHSNGAAHTPPTGSLHDAGANTDANGQCTIVFTSPLGRQGDRPRDRDAHDQRRHRSRSRPTARAATAPTP